METHTKNPAIAEINSKISTLWVVVMLNMAFADIVGLLNPGAMQEMMAMKPASGVLLVFSGLIGLPIAMIFLSRVLKPRVNRCANIIVSSITALWIIGGGNSSASYIFFAAMEILAMLGIVGYARKLPVAEADNV